MDELNLACTIELGSKSAPAPFLLIFVMKFYTLAINSGSWVVFTVVLHSYQVRIDRDESQNTLKLPLLVFLVCNGRLRRCNVFSKYSIGNQLTSFRYLCRQRRWVETATRLSRAAWAGIPNSSLATRVRKQPPTVPTDKSTMSRRNA